MASDKKSLKATWIFFSKVSQLGVINHYTCIQGFGDKG
jgi:hypothetical protein